MRALLLVMLATGCWGGASSSTTASTTPVPPPPVEPVAPPPPQEPPPDQVAIEDGADPCDGGEVAPGMGGLGTSGTGRGGGGTGEGTIGLGSHGTIGAGGGTGSGYGAGKGRPGPGPSVRPGAPAVTGDLDKDVIRRVIRHHLARIRHCYERQLVKDPELAGRVEVRFVIAPDGTVKHATATGVHAEVERCVAHAFLAMRFPATRSAGMVKVAYPFVFQPSP